MKWYFAAKPEYVHLLLEEKVGSILMSYAHMKSKGIPEGVQKAFKAGKVNLMIDSGAFTNASKPGTVTLEGYRDFLKSNKGNVTEYVTLDDLKRREITLKNLEVLRKDGLNPQMVDHMWFSWASALDPEYKSGRKMCWGGLVSKQGQPSPAGRAGSGRHARDFDKEKERREERERWLREHKKGDDPPMDAFTRRVTHRAGFARVKPLSKIHLLGVGMRLKRFLPFADIVDSFDTASWRLAPSRFGKVVWVSRDDNGWPGLHLKNWREVAPDMAKKLKSMGFDLSKEIDRNRIAIRAFKAFFKMVEERHDKAKEAGENISLLKSDVWESEIDPMGFAFEELEVLLMDLPEEERMSILRGDAGRLDRQKCMVAVSDFADEDLLELADVVGSEVRERATILLKDDSLATEGSSTEDEKDVRLLVDKADKADERNIVFGVVLEPDEVDTQKDTIKAEEIERAAHLWMARFQDRGVMHRRVVNSKIEIYESYIAPVNLTIAGQKVKKGTWLLMYHVTDPELWGKIKRGEITGFSMGGFARRVKL